MKVREMIKELQGMDPDAEVKAMMQPEWPFECQLKRVLSREDMADEYEDELRTDQKRNDVFVVVGAQLGYGNHAAWE